MDDIKKILLGDKDIISKNNEDLFINLNINTTFSEIKNEKHENVFDIENQFKKERNSSRDFKIYGIIDSTIINCNNLILNIYSISGTNRSEEFNGLSGFVKSINSTSLVYDGLNAYGMKKGKFFIELTGYTNDYVYIKIPSNNFNYKDQIYSQQLIFKDASGNFVDYGTETIDISNSGEAIEINNNFYFFYNKHWIKKDLLITEEKNSEIYFSAISDTQIVNETNSVSATFNVVLSKKSSFGIEQAQLNILSKTLDSSEIILTDQDNNKITNFPLNLTFKIDEQVKEFSFYSPLDKVQEFVENVIFSIENLKNVLSATPIIHTIEVKDITPRNTVTLNFQDFFQNRDYFVGQKYTSQGATYSNPMPAVLRNGLKYGSTPMEFYPIDNYNIKITNIGNNTILPINSILNITEEKIFESGKQLEFNINQNYKNTEKNSIIFTFPVKKYTGTLGTSYYANQDGYIINGIPIVDYLTGINYKFDYDTILACLKKQPRSDDNLSIGGWNRYDLDTPFDIIENVTELKITLVAKSPGIRLDVFSYGNPLNITYQTVQKFIYSAQTALKITLGANFNNNSQAKYSFEITKKGYNTLLFTSSTLNASVNSPNYYLVSSYNNILRNLDKNNKPIYVHSGITSGWPNYALSEFGLYTIGDVYINGLLFLGNKYFDNTLNTSSYIVANNSLNKTSFGNTSGDFTANFLPNPIDVIPATNSYLSVETTKQSGVLRVLNGPATNQPGVNTFRSFNFRTGTTANYTTFYFDSPYYAATNGFYLWNYYNIFSSGGTSNVKNQIPLKYYLQDGYTPLSIKSKGLTGFTPVSLQTFQSVNLTYGLVGSINDYLKLDSLTEGIGYDINNIKDFKKSNGSLLLGEPSIMYLPLIPNQIKNSTLNQANNQMGGYSTNIFNGTIDLSNITDEAQPNNLNNVTQVVQPINSIDLSNITDAAKTNNTASATAKNIANSTPIASATTSTSVSINNANAPSPASNNGAASITSSAVSAGTGKG